MTGEIAAAFDLVHLEVGYGTEEASRLERLTDAVRKTWRLRALVRRHPGSIVHLNPSMDTRSLVRDLPMLVVAARNGARVVVQFHGGLMDRPRPMRYRLVRRAVVRALERAYVIVVLSQLQKESISSTLGDSHGLAIAQVPLFLDVRAYEQRSAARATSGPINSFVFVGRLVNQKGVNELIEAAALLRRDGLDVLVDVAGAGPDEAEMRRRCELVGMSAAVRWHGYLEDEAKLDLLARSDVFVLASSWLEGLPNALLEAMTMGLPVIVSDVGAMAEVVEDGVNGFVVPAGDPRALAAKMSYLVENPQQARAMGRRNRDLARLRFGMERQVDAWREIYLAAPGERTTNA